MWWNAGGFYKHAKNALQRAGAVPHPIGPDTRRRFGVRSGSEQKTVSEGMKPYYEHAGITIYHGDCREVLPSLPPADLIFTSPPSPSKIQNPSWSNGRYSILTKWTA